MRWLQLKGHLYHSPSAKTCRLHAWLGVFWSNIKTWSVNNMAWTFHWSWLYPLSLCFSGILREVFQVYDKIINQWKIKQGIPDRNVCWVRISLPHRTDNSYQCSLCPWTSHSMLKRLRAIHRPQGQLGRFQLLPISVRTFSELLRESLAHEWIDLETPEMNLCRSSFQWGTTNEVLWKFTSGIYRGYGHFTKWGYLGNLYYQMITTYFQESSTLDCEGKWSFCLLFGYAVNFSLYSCQEIWILTSSACLGQLHEVAVHFSNFCWHVSSFFCPFAYLLFSFLFFCTALPSFML